LFEWNITLKHNNESLQIDL